MDIGIFADSSVWVSLLTLTFLEVILGIDNIIFISIVSNKLPATQQRKARNLGLLLAMVFRILLLLLINWILGLTKPLFTIPALDIAGLLESAHPVSGRDLILLAGGLFLMAKSTTEIFHKMEGKDELHADLKKKASFFSVLVQIILLDMVFSFDSILTAVGLTEHVLVMIIAVIISIGIMMVFAGAISRFINKNPSLQILALSFLILIGFMLILEGFHKEIPKAYIYFAVFYALVIELINLRRRKKVR